MREHRLREGLAAGLSLAAISSRFHFCARRLSKDCRRLGLATAAPKPERGFRDDDLSPEALKRSCAWHFHDLARGYPGRKLRSLDIPEGYAPRLTIGFAEVVSRSVAADCAEFC